MQCYVFTATKDKDTTCSLCWPMHFHLSMSPTKPINYVNETGLLPGIVNLNDFTSYSRVYIRP